MHRLLIAAALAATAATTAGAYPIPRSQQECAPLATVLDFLHEEYGEVPAWNGRSFNDNSAVSVTTNDQAGTWTLLSTVKIEDELITCIVGFGDNSKKYIAGIGV